MSNAKIQSELRNDGQVLHLLLNAPKANILDGEMMGQISAALDEYENHPNLKAIVFEGSGKHFSFGASVEEHTKERASQMLSSFHGLFRRLSNLGIPTCSIVRGQCLGGGMELASYTSWIFATPTAAFGQPESNLAVFPPMASLLLPWRVGGARAVDLCVSGRSIRAAEAKEIGLVHSVDEDPAATCDAFIERYLLPKSASSLRYIEKAARLSLSDLLERQLPALESLYLDELMETHDANEGINAFIEKRQPRYETATGTTA
jgi:cyclohexa-1,5-dienecarbonyl-CoA hydratase